MIHAVRSGWCLVRVRQSIGARRLAAREAACRATGLAESSLSVTTLASRKSEPPRVYRDGNEAVHLACEHRPDVAVLDVSMPKTDGMEATKLIRKCCPEVSVLALTRHDDRAHLNRMLQAGATGYVLKQSPAADLVRAIRTVASGQTYVDPILAGPVLSRSARTRGLPPPWTCSAPGRRRYSASLHGGIATSRSERSSTSVPGRWRPTGRGSQRSWDCRPGRRSFAMRSPRDGSLPTDPAPPNDRNPWAPRGLRRHGAPRSLGSLDDAQESACRPGRGEHAVRVFTGESSHRLSQEFFVGKEAEHGGSAPR
jgi:CheY-like chemotaxis protein